MKFWPFNKSSASPNAVKHEVEVTGALKSPIKPEHAVTSALSRNAPNMPIKSGMWVRHGEHTGILVSIGEYDIAKVMYTDATNGENVLEINVPCSALKQARYEEIPEARRPPYEVAAKFGYIRK